MFVKFIAHAGIAIQENDFTILIDPWFRDSTLEHPIIEGINGTKTIEFQIPPAKESLDAYAPQVILLSHFHTHHSPLRDVFELIENTYHDVILAHPNGPDNAIAQEKIGILRHATLQPMNNAESFTVGPFTITAYSHTNRNHLAWSVKSATGHILHIADGMLNSDFSTTLLDAAWDKFVPLEPDIIFMSAGRNSLRIEEPTGKRRIIEAGCISPIQAARLIQLLKPKVLSSIGNHNHSFKKNRLEFIPETSANEEELRWALSWLAPATRFVPVRPGHSFSLGEEFASNDIADTYL